MEGWKGGYQGEIKDLKSSSLQIHCQALRPIAEGEEITLKHGIFPFPAHAITVLGKTSRLDQTEYVKHIYRSPTRWVCVSPR